MADRTPIADESLEDVLASANDASGQARNVYLAFILVGAYIAITIGATTDEQLLRGAPVNLPVLNVGLPIVGFYLLVPWLLVVLHLNLLLQLYFLARRVHRLRDRLARLSNGARSTWLSRLHGFPFSHYIARGQRGFVRVVLAAMVVGTVLLFPLALLIAAQVRFLPYHDVTITWTHRLAVLADVGLLWLFWPVTVEPSWRSVMTRALPRVAGVATPATVLALGFSWTVATVPGELPDRLFDTPSRAPLHRNLRLPEAVLFQTDPSPEALHALEADDPRALERIRGLDLSNRDLRGADLRNARLARADLRGADLEDVDLGGADLREADLRGLDVTLGGSCVSDARQRTPLASPDAVADADVLLPRQGDPVVCRTSLAGAKLARADLRGARLQLADLSGADLRETALEAARLWGASLRDARLDGARASGSELRNADLAGASLDGASLRGVDLSTAELEGWTVDGADLSEVTLPAGAPLAGARLTRLHHARLPRADLRGADLSGADLTGADLAGANLAGASLAEAELDGADLERAELPGADLSRIELRARRLPYLDLRGATLARASLQGVMFHECELDGASLAGAELQHAHFYQTSLRGADLARARVGGARLYVELGLADLEQLDARPLPPEALAGLRSAASDLPGGLNETESLDEALALASTRGPVLCPDGPPSPELTQACVGRDGVDRYVAALAAFACAEPAMIERIARRALERPIPRRLSERAEAMRLHPPLTAYGPPLARALLDPECEAAGDLGPELRADLEELAEREGRPAR